jgi:hypothetical protein
MADTPRAPIGTALLVLIGGAAIVGGCFLPWVVVEGGITIGQIAVAGEPAGIEFQLGSVALVSGIAAVVLGLLALVMRRARRVWGLLLLLCSAAAVVAASLMLSAPQERYIDLAVTTDGVPQKQTDEITISLGALFEAGTEAQPGVGVYACLAGGAVVAIGGLLLLLRRGRSPGAHRARGAAKASVGVDPRAPVPTTATEPVSIVDDSPVSADADVNRSGPHAGDLFEPQEVWEPRPDTIPPSPVDVEPGTGRG